MKQSTVWECVSKLLSNHTVATRIAELQEEYAEATRVDRAKVEKVLMGIVEVDPTDMYYIDEATGKPKLKAPNQMPVHLRKALKKIKNKRGEVSYEFNGKTEAAKLLASMNGWEAPKKVEMGGNMAIEGKHVMDFSGLPEDDESEQ
jgi:phage terminase small subunit